MRHNLIVREPELYFDSIHQELDNFLRDTFISHTFGHPLNMIKNTILRPAIEVIQNKDNYKVKVQLPGIKKDNIDVEIDNDFMTICAETHEEKEEEKQDENNKRYHTSEFRYGKYQRTISFDQPIKSDEAQAEYKDGILTITIPKQNIETKEPKKLEIKEK
ncbi:Hsp20/alpha crystallin family protein [bacterium]|nr:Hsp20/alpha crystallin family protein [bacterium]MBO5447072.1 Hsp20/alpha crystallin family protein [bacterium]